MIFLMRVCSGGAYTRLLSLCVSVLLLVVVVLVVVVLVVVGGVVCVVVLLFFGRKEGVYMRCCF